MQIKVCVAGEGSSGPELWFVKVSCTEQQYAEGEHYQAASKWVAEEFDAEVSWACDERDPAKAVIDLFNWETATVVEV
jgi:hypothetical protein